MGVHPGVSFDALFYVIPRLLFHFMVFFHCLMNFYSFLTCDLMEL